MALKAESLYNALKESGYELESSNSADFYAKLKADPSKAVTLFNTLQQDDTFQLDSKSPEDFITRLGLKKKRRWRIFSRYYFYIESSSYHYCAGFERSRDQGAGQRAEGD